MKNGLSRRSLWKLTDERLLDMRMKNLPVRIEGSALEARIRRLHDELEERGIKFKPHVWLAHEWFTPDGVPGIAVPFYLTHPRLMKLEHKQMLDVEGGSDAECMRILRHEAGHALDNAYRLHFRRRWRESFGSFREPYPQSYKPRPGSRNYVLHLTSWYAQAHPAEDFAETFAVWLTPGSRWRVRYSGWPALKKLQYVNDLMEEIAGTTPKNKKRIKVDPLSKATITLREHYRRRREYYQFKWPAYYDRDLRRIFSHDPKHRARPSAATFIRKYKKDLRQIVSEGTGVHQYTIDYVIEDIISRCKHLKLKLNSNESETRQRVMIMLTVHTMNAVHSGYSRIAL
jgi:putative zinc-binding metallo-peptidase